MSNEKPLESGTGPIPYRQQLANWFKEFPNSTLSCAQVFDALDNKTKPVRSLGQLEHWAAQLAMQQQTLKPVVGPSRIIVFGGDHGVANDGVSAFPAAVTAQMMANFDAGGAAVCVLAAGNNIEVEVIDVGVNADLQMLNGIVHEKVALGTRNFCEQPAMNNLECQRAMQVGERAVERAVADGIVCVGFGEMGIGNTTSAATLGALLCQLPANKMVGRGTGIDDAVLLHKQSIVEDAITRYSSLAEDPTALLAAVGGLEIAAISGAMLHAHSHNLVVVVDGFICTAAALVALRLDPMLRRSLYFAHQSAEAGHRSLLDTCEAEPMLSMQMRLGEGSGCALAIPLLASAAAMLANMATFETAGVSGKTQ